MKASFTICGKVDRELLVPVILPAPAAVSPDPGMRSAISSH